MIPLRLVVDTNIVVSAALKPDVLQRTVVLLAMTKPAQWYVSEEILVEYAAILARPELKIRKSLRQQLLQWIKNHARIVIPARLSPITGDPADNKFIECADAARADYLVTGNQRHFPQFWKNTKVISSRDFLNIIAPHLIG
ncbi:MAG TPA: putative toxin-antitoxin system toxin component, PIN family [Candidatus Angelobacter sp.]|nr:putative toxin-antitoxin system toxin component, PIN family [Candidatus Angelobacter sp.]